MTRPHRRAIVTAGIAVLVLAVGTVIIVAVARRADGPEGAARSYLSALAGGDADAVMGRVIGGRDAHPDAAAAFEGAVGLISDVSIERVDVDGGSARVRAGVALAGTARTLDFTLTDIDGRWLVDDGFLGALTVEASVGDAIRIGDATLAEGALALLPGEYEVRGAPEGLVDGEATVTVAGDRPSDLELTTSLSAHALAQAQEQLRAYATRCTATADAAPRGCGLQIPWAADLRRADRFAYRVERFPTLELQADGRAFAASGGVVVATVSGEDRSGEAASFTYRDDAWALRGSVTVDAGGVTLQVR